MRIECKYDEMMPLEEVEKMIHPDNENSHPEKQIQSLAKVIAKIGIRHPIHISKKSKLIAGGHGRLLAFKKLGYKEVPIVWENFKDELEELNYRASDNIGQYAEFDKKSYIENLESAGFELEELDFEEFGLVDLDFQLNSDDAIEDSESDDNQSNDQKFLLEIQFPNEMEMMDIHDELVPRGYIVKIK